MGFVGVKFVYNYVNMSLIDYYVANSRVCLSNKIRQSTTIMNFTLLRKIFIENVDLLLKV